jgi:hypothetical protein
MTRELHVIRAHLLHYDSLLQDFRKSVEFILETPNPAITPSHEAEQEREILEREAGNLFSEIKRLQVSRMNQNKRLQNVIKLVS